MDDNSHSDEPVNDDDAQAEIQRNEHRDDKRDIFKEVIRMIKVKNMFRKNGKFRKANYDDDDDDTTNKEDYRIAISQDGKFAVTFDTANLRIKVLENTDYRDYHQPEYDKKKLDSSNQNESDEYIDKKIAYFKIDDNFNITRFYKPDFTPRSFEEIQKSKFNNIDGKKISNVAFDNPDSNENKPNDKPDDFKWSFDISNLHKNGDEAFILVAISRINVAEDMKNNEEAAKKIVTEQLSELNFPARDVAVDISQEHSEPSQDAVIKKGIIIYRINLTINKNDYDLNSITRYCSDQISGICSFIEAPEDEDDDKSHVVTRRFIILNFHGIYNFEFNKNFDFFTLGEKFEYPQSIKRELNNWFTDKGDDCMKRLLSCIYDRYFLVTQYKNDVQSLEVYDLAKMELETTAKKVENKEKFLKKYNYDTFSISKLQLCFTRGIKSIKLYYLENGLQVTSKKFDDIEKIYLLEFISSDEKLLIIGKGPEEGEKGLKFIIWDLYNTGKVESTTLDNFPMKIIENLGTRLARTSGNILQIDDDGRVSSVLKKVENELNRKKEKEKKKLDKIFGKNIKLKEDKIKKQIGNHTMYYDKNIMDFNPIIINKEPWVLEDYERVSYCLYHNQKGTEVESLQLIVGRSTVQIWHQIKDDDCRNKEHLPNKGEPFLEYIWTNRIPVNQEENKTRLRIKKFKCGQNDESHEKLVDFRLEVCWYIISNEENIGKAENVKKVDHGKADTEIDEIEKELKNELKNELKELEKTNDEKEREKIKRELIKNNKRLERRDKVIKRKDIVEKFHAVRHACKALEHFNKRYKSKYLVNSYIRVHEYEEMVTYIKHIVWRFAKLEPENFKLLDVRHNVLKSLILGDCDHLIKFVLFGDEDGTTESKNGCKNKKEQQQKDFVIRHIPRDVLWQGETFLKDDDLDFYYERKDKDNMLEDNEKIKPVNNVELAIHHCKGRELKDTIIVAYLLEYYSRHATDCAGWMSSVSKAIPLLFKYNYDDYARKLFFKECFAVQDHFSAQDPDEIIPKEYLARRNHDIKFRAFRPKVELNTNKQELYYKIMDRIKSFKNIIIKKYENYDNDLGKSPLALRVVPLPSFTINDIPKKKETYNLRNNILNILLLIFIPRCEIFNSFDIISTVLSVTIMTIMFKSFQFSDGFGSVKAIDTSLIAGISFAIFLLWVELIFYLRIISIFAFAHTMFVLLRDPEHINTKGTTYSGNATNPSTNETLNVKLKADFDPTSSDNPYTSFSQAIITTYFWISGSWVQRDEFDFWAIDVFSLIASIFLVIVLQNMLIAFMSGVYATAETKGRQTLLRNRANIIADYEALHHIHFWKHEPEPKHIYYFGQSKTLEEWYKTRKNDQGAIYQEFEEKITFTRRIFKERNYDKFSIWEYNDDIKMKIEKIKTMKNDLNININCLIEKLKKDQKNEKEMNGNNIIESIDNFLKVIEKNL
ncbi:hypothetical protein RclHR1_03480007 [Rhizophagus clarus]|uniref:Ion transport domain-containing protein n=1 Tax=Rhizophagus clarus TaxID=94130 RepID=A0A2Z6RB12_9GLOM|nr:hypothetical protein RclHR1_03480007 [Rhizophagus clarus]